MRQKSNILSYWSILLALCSGPKVIAAQLDVPLDVAVPRAWSALTWTLLLFTLSAIIATPTWLSHPLHHIALPSTAVLGFAFVLSIPILYGFFRLYTLVNHIITINIFKTRGQRLRLLNLETKILSLSAPLAALWLVYQLRPTLAIYFAAVVILYGIYLSGYGYNLVFHKTKWRGIALFIQSSIVSWFVLAIGALAVTVALSVLSFFILLILRPFLHH